MSLYGAFILINAIAEIEYDGVSNIIIALILGASMVISVAFLSSAMTNSAIWGGLGGELDELVDAIIRLLEWLQANGYLDRAVEGGGII